MRPSITLDLLPPSLLRWGGALLFVALWYLVSQAAIGHFFQIRLEEGARALDLGAHLLLGAALFGLARSLPRFVLTATVLFSALAVSNAMKLAILGAPIMPDDFAAARNMFLLLDGWLLAGAALLVTLPVVLLGWMTAWRRPGTWLQLGLLGLLGWAFVAKAGLVVGTLDRQIGHSVWNQPGNFQTRGLPLHLVQETARNLSRRVAPPTESEVADALAHLGHQPGEDLVRVASSPSRPPRNLHMIVLESFWDPRVLKASQLSADPFDPELRKLWKQAGQSHLLSPVFGGYTANTELEVLCGFPVTEDNVFFESGLKRDVPCLPRHLGEAGYHSVASHPNSASFWNRVNAYRRVGFETYRADKDFQLDDMNDTFLSDVSLYRQVMEQLRPELRGSRPLFNYVLTYFGHLPYPLNDQRPPVITAAEGHEVVAAYANTVYYKSRELMAFLKELREADPDALIVLFGDHLPALKPNFGGYRESGLLAERRGDFRDAMFPVLTQTPLIIIDGQKGAVPVGEVPAYQLPALILGFLGDHRSTILSIAGPLESGARIRPLPGMHFSLKGKDLTVCRESNLEQAECAASAQWVKAIETLRTDLLGGMQHALLDLHTPATELREAAVPSAPSPYAGNL